MTTTIIRSTGMSSAAATTTATAAGAAARLLCGTCRRPLARSPSARAFSSSAAAAPASSSSFSAAPVPNRSVIEISGRDTLKLLQGLVTNNVSRLGAPSEPGAAAQPAAALYAGFLHPNGRLLADTLLYGLSNAPAPASPAAPSDTVLIEVDSRAADSLLAFLKKFKLRSKVALRLADAQEWKVWHLWSPGPTALTPPSSPADGQPASPLASPLTEALEALAAERAQIRRDPRSAHLGFRALLPGASAAETHLTNSADSTAYLVHRLLQGIPEGHDDIVDASSLPLEVNMDLNAGVDFSKGCYVGQELTARTHHTGVVRKRVVPVSFYSADKSPPSSLALDESFQTLQSTTDADVRSSATGGSTRRPRSAGKLLGTTVHNLGLGLLRLDQVERVQAGAGEEGGARMRIEHRAADGQVREVGVRPFIPASWDPQVVESVRLAAA